MPKKETNKDIISSGSLNQLPIIDSVNRKGCLFITYTEKENMVKKYSIIT